MSQMSQLSDIIPDVDKFIVENGMEEDVGRIMKDNNVHLVNDDGVEETYKTSQSEYVPLDYFKTCPTQTLFPPDQPSNLGTEEYPGPYNFDVLIVPSGQKAPWEYSVKLNKIFIAINLKFPILFVLHNRPPTLSLFVRVTPIYSQTHHFEDIVHRCVSHRHPHDPSNKDLDPHIFQHIMRCSNEETRYFGDKNKGTRLNIVLPLGHPQVGEDVVKEFFQFVCKNSCPLGMNRRPIDVVFTLEDENGEVLGRRLVSVRVCSCPKRDKEKEEKDLEKNDTGPSKKKRKTERVVPEGQSFCDDQMFTLNIKIPGKKNYLDVLKNCRNIMANEILKTENENGGDSGRFRNCYNEVAILMSKVPSE